MFGKATNVITNVLIFKMDSQNTSNQGKSSLQQSFPFIGIRCILIISLGKEDANMQWKYLSSDNTVITLISNTLPVSLVIQMPRMSLRKCYYLNSHLFRVSLWFSAVKTESMFRWIHAMKSPRGLYGTGKVANGVDWIIQLWMQSLVWHLKVCTLYDCGLLCRKSWKMDMSFFVWEQEVVRNIEVGRNHKLGKEMEGDIDKDHTRGGPLQSIYSYLWQALYPREVFSRKADLLLPSKCIFTTSTYHSFMPESSHLTHHCWGLNSCSAVELRPQAFQKKDLIKPS